MKSVYEKYIQEKKLIEGLLAINCKHNHCPRENGKCYSTICMMNQDKEIAKDIRENGCIIWTKLDNWHKAEEIARRY